MKFLIAFHERRLRGADAYQLISLPVHTAPTLAFKLFPAEERLKWLTTHEIQARFRFAVD